MIIKSHEIPKIVRGHWSTQGLVGYWPMMPYEVGGSIIHDLSENNNTGTFVADTHFVPGPFGPALDFDGVGDYVSVGDKPSLDFGTRNFSVSVLIKTGGESIAIIGKQNTDSGWYLYVDGSVNNWVCSFYHRKDTNYVRGTTALNDNKLHHIIFVRDGRDGYIYVDGQDDTALTDNISGTVDSAGDIFEIGRRKIGPADDRYFDGLIDLPIIWNRALSLSERTELFRNPLLPIEREPIELWVGATSVGVPPEVANPKGPLGHPLCGAFAGPISF